MFGTWAKCKHTCYVILRSPKLCKWSMVQVLAYDIYECNRCWPGLVWSVREGSRKSTKQANKQTAFSFIRISCRLFVMQYTGLWLSKATSQCIEPQQRQRQRRQAEVAATTVAMELRAALLCLWEFVCNLMNRCSENWTQKAACRLLHATCHMLLLILIHKQVQCNAKKFLTFDPKSPATKTPAEQLKQSINWSMAYCLSSFYLSPPLFIIDEIKCCKRRNAYCLLVPLFSCFDVPFNICMHNWLKVCVAKFGQTHEWHAPYAK